MKDNFKTSLYSALGNKKLAVIFSLLFISDVVSKVGDMILSPISFTSMALKSAFQVLLFYYIIKFNNRKALMMLVHMAYLFVIFLFGHAFLKNEAKFSDTVLYNLKNFNWYIFIFIIQAALITFLRQRNVIEELKFLFRTLEFIFYINCCCVLIGLLFNLEIFKAYFYTPRFGFNGLFRNATHASFIFIIYIIYFHYKLKFEKTKQAKIRLIISIIICAALMTKAVILFVILYGIYKSINLKKYYILTIIFSIAVSTVIFFDSILEGFIKKYFRVLYNVYNEDGLMTMLFSYRNKSISEKFIPYLKENWTAGNYILGGAEFNIMRTEFELLDLYWLFGFGAFLYFYYYNLYIIAFKTIFKEVPFLILFIVVLLAGSFLSSASVTLFFMVLLLFYRYPDLHLKK